MDVARVTGSVTDPVTERLALRRFTPDDTDWLLALNADPDVMRFLGPVATSRAEISARVLPLFLTCHTRHPHFGYWAAVARDRTAGEPIGWFGLKPVAPPPGDAWIDDWPEAPAGAAAVVSLGYRLRRTAWGCGYATEGARALVAGAFAQPGVSRVVATTMAVNAGSRRVLEKAGLKHTRTVFLSFPDPLPGTEHGDVEYELRREEWAALPL